MNGPCQTNRVAIKEWSHWGEIISEGAFLLTKTEPSKEIFCCILTLQSICPVEDFATSRRNKKCFNGANLILYYE